MAWLKIQRDQSPLSGQEERFTFSVVEHLVEAVVVAPDFLHVVLFESSLNDRRCVVLTGQLEKKNPTKENSSHLFPQNSKSLQ